MFSLKRLREQAGLFAAILGVVALVSGLSVGVIGYLAQSANEGVRAGLASRAGADLALRASLALDPDAEKQDAEVRAAVARSFPGIRIAIDRTVSSRVELHRLEGGEVSGGSYRAEALSIPDLPERATLVDGSWPASPDEVTIQAQGAERLHVAVGDQIELGDLAVTVSGTWQVSDPLDPRWLGESLITDGTDDTDELWLVFGSATVVVVAV